MKLRLCLLASASAVLLQLDARGEAPVEADSRAEAELSEKIDSIVSRALDVRLLQSDESRSAIADSDRHAAPSASPAPTRIDCSVDDPFAFDAVASVASYADLMTLAAGKGDGPEALLLRAKAEIAVGLNSESIVSLSDAPPVEAQPLVKLARLMERRHDPDVDYFISLSSCQESANLWLAAAYLLSGDAAGATLLQAQLTAFRDLPLSLRTDYALIAVPALHGLDNDGLSQKLLASFSEDEIAGSTRLQFLKALAGLRANDSAAADAVRSFLLTPEFRTAAFAALYNSDAEIDPLVRLVFIEDITRAAQSDASGRSVALARQIALDEMERQSNYAPILSLASLASKGATQADDSIEARLIENLKRDLESDDALRRLQALDALVNARMLSADNAEHADLFVLGTQTALQLGRTSLAEALAVKSAHAASIDEQKARAAYARSDEKTLVDLALRHPDATLIVRLAALRMIDTGDSNGLRRFETSLSLDAASILALIEHDAMTGQWIVSDDIYRAAQALTAAEAQQRVARVMALKAARSNASSGETPLVSDISAALTKSRQALEQLPSGAP
jgi:hypothetical protein